MKWSRLRVDRLSFLVIQCRIICSVSKTYTITTKFLLFSAEEKKLVNDVFSNAIDCLSDEDKMLPQVKHWLNIG